MRSLYFFIFVLILSNSVRGDCRGNTCRSNSAGNFDNFGLQPGTCENGVCTPDGIESPLREDSSSLDGQDLLPLSSGEPIDPTTLGGGGSASSRGISGGSFNPSFDSFKGNIFDSRGARVHNCGRFLCVGNTSIFIGDNGEILVKDPTTQQLIQADTSTSQQVIALYQDWARRIQTGQVPNDPRFAIANRALIAFSTGGGLNGFNSPFGFGGTGATIPETPSGGGLPSQTPIDPSTPGTGSNGTSTPTTPGTHANSNGTEPRPNANPQEETDPNTPFKRLLKEFEEGKSPLNEIKSLPKFEKFQSKEPKDSEITYKSFTAVCESSTGESPSERVVVIQTKKEIDTAIWLTDKIELDQKEKFPAEGAFEVTAENKGLQGKRKNSEEQMRLSTVTKDNKSELWLHHITDKDHQIICREKKN